MCTATLRELEREVSEKKECKSRDLLPLDTQVQSHYARPAFELWRVLFLHILDLQIDEAKGESKSNAEEVSSI